TARARRPRDPPRLARVALPPLPAGRSRRPAVPLREVPHHAPRRRAAARGAPGRRPGRPRGVRALPQADERPAHHTGGARTAPPLDRRVPPARERTAGPDEPRRPPAVPGERARGHGPGARPDIPGEAGDHGLLAGRGPQRGQLRGTPGHGGALRAQLVGVVGPGDTAAHAHRDALAQRQVAVAAAVDSSPCPLWRPKPTRGRLTSAPRAPAS